MGISNIKQAYDGVITVRTLNTLSINEQCLKKFFETFSCKF